jgi:FtsH-binding integral membrane protein
MVSTTMVALYLAGALVATAVILEAAPHFAPGQSVPRRSTYAIIGASLWPILVVGLIELGSVMAFTRRVQNSAMENDLRLIKR